MNDNKLVSLDDAALDEVNGGAFTIGGNITIKLPSLTLPDLGDFRAASKTIADAIGSLLPRIGLG